MKKRVVATVLWAFVGWTGGSLVTGIFGVPMMLAVIPAIVMPAFVLWDPTGTLWQPWGAGKRTRRPINELAAELDQKSGLPIVGQQEQRHPR